MVESPFHCMMRENTLGLISHHGSLVSEEHDDCGSSPMDTILSFQIYLAPVTWHLSTLQSEAEGTPTAFFPSTKGERNGGSCHNNNYSYRAILLRNEIK